MMTAKRKLRVTGMRSSLESSRWAYLFATSSKPCAGRLDLGHDARVIVEERTLMLGRVRSDRDALKSVLRSMSMISDTWFVSHIKAEEISKILERENLRCRRHKVQITT